MNTGVRLVFPVFFFIHRAHLYLNDNETKLYDFMIGVRVMLSFLSSFVIRLSSLMCFILTTPTLWILWTERRPRRKMSNIEDTVVSLHKNADFFSQHFRHRRRFVSLDSRKCFIIQHIHSFMSEGENQQKDKKKSREMWKCCESL